MKNWQKPIKWTSLMVLCLATYCPGAWSKTWIVGKPNTPCANANYATITAAINASSPGDVIEVCPALYPEQLVITKPLTLRGNSQQGIGRVLIQPAQMLAVGFMPFTAVVTVMNTANVTIQNVAVDAGSNTITGCTVALAGIHFYNASGILDADAISGAKLKNPLSCATLFPGNGFGVQIDEDATSTASHRVTVRNSSIHDFSRNGILAVGSNETVDIEGNSIMGAGPATGANQFGIFLADGATGRIAGNNIAQGSCGTIPILDCFDLRSEGVVLRSVGGAVVVEGNTISNVQVGVFVNGAANVRVLLNTISNVDALSGIHIQGSTSGTFIGNRIFHVGPFTADTNEDEEGCGINDVSGAGNSANAILGNLVSDAYCGVAFVTGDRVQANVYRNTLYETLNADNYPDVFPPAVEPGQPPAAPHQSRMTRQLRQELP